MVTEHSNVNKCKLFGKILLVKFQIYNPQFLKHWQQSVIFKIPGMLSKALANFHEQPESVKISKHIEFTWHKNSLPMQDNYRDGSHSLLPKEHKQAS